MLPKFIFAEILAHPKTGLMSLNSDTGLVTDTSDRSGGTVIVSVTLTKEHRLVHTILDFQIVKLR